MTQEKKTSRFVAVTLLAFHLWNGALANAEETKVPQGSPVNAIARAQSSGPGSTTGPPVTLEAAAANDVLPDGTVFRSWEQPRRYSQTYHVAQGDPQASDANPGTADRPWRTIGKAAATLRPGERVIVHRGVYREWVRPERGGTGPDQMIWYEAAPGEDVQITGSDTWTPEWRATNGAWRAALDPKLFPGENPFALENFPVPPSPEWKRFPSMDSAAGNCSWTATH